MADSIRRVTHQSYGSRMKNTCFGFLVAPILIIGALSVLVWNEGNTVAVHRSLDEGLRQTRNLPSADSVDVGHEGHLVHVCGEATTKDNLTDNEFGVSPGNHPLVLGRTVKMYQWVQHEQSTTTKNTGGSTTTDTTYTYSKEWKEGVMQSNNFEDEPNHENPSSIPYQDFTIYAKPIDLGAFVLPSSLTASMASWQTSISNVDASNIPDDNFYKSTAVNYRPGGLQMGSLYTLTSPEVGDLRIDWNCVESPLPVSIVAQQSGSSFQPYPTKAGKSVMLMERGVVSTEEMFQHAQDAAKLTAWIVRVFGFLFVYVGLRMAAQPLATASDVLPCIGDLMGTMTSCIAFPIALFLSGVVILLSWIAYRPFLAGSLLVIMLCVGHWMVKRRSTFLTTDGEFIAVAVPVTDDDPEMNHGTSYKDDPSKGNRIF